MYKIHRQTEPETSLVDFWEQQNQILVQALQQSGPLLIQIAKEMPLTFYLDSKLPDQGNILDAGCGTPETQIALAKEGRNFVGVDIAGKTIEQCKHMTPNRLIVGDICSLPFEENLFDAVLCKKTLEHIQSGPDQPLEEFHRVLKPGGKLILIHETANLEDTFLLNTKPFHRDIAYPYYSNLKLKMHKISGFDDNDPTGFYGYIFSKSEMKRFIHQHHFKIQTIESLGYLSGLMRSRWFGKWATEIQKQERIKRLQNSERNAFQKWFDQWFLMEKTQGHPIRKLLRDYVCLFYRQYHAFEAIKST